MKKMNFAAGAAIIAMAAGLTCACSSDDNAARSNYPKDNVVRVATNVSDMLTRGSFTTETLGDMGLSILNSGNDNYSYANVKLTKDAGKWTSAQLMLWQNSTQTVDVVAYAPYNPNVTDRVSTMEKFPVSVQAVQTADDNSSDFLVFKKLGFNPGTDLNAQGAIPVNFKHGLCQLNISIKLGTEFDQAGKLTASPIKGLTVGGTFIDGTCDFKSARSTEDILPNITLVNGSKPQNVQPYEVPNSFKEATGTEGHEVSNATATYSCILLPQIVEKNTFTVSFTIGDKTYQWTSPDEVDLELGKKHTLELNVGKDVVVPGTFTVKAWTDGGSSNKTTD